MVKTLEQLKQQNAEAEAAEKVAQPSPAGDTEAQADSEWHESPSEPDDSAEAPDAQDVPLWMQAEEQESAESGQMPVRSHIAVKQKLKGRLRNKDGEIEQLRSELNQLKSAAQPAPVVTPPPAPAQTAMPKAEDFYDAKDPDSAYQAALQRWMNQGVEERLNQHLQIHQQQQQRQQLDTRINQELERHYDRAAKIVSEGLLSADEYQDSESLIRQSVDHIAPGKGDSYVDSLLSRLGDGSEKVVVSLARNASHMAAFQQALRDDPTGISAASFLGELKGRFTGASRVSKTPRPGTRLNGDAPTTGGADQRQYKAAHKSGNRQKAFDIKRAAKARGVDTSKW